MPRLEEFLKALPKGFSYAFEFRDESWFDERIYELLTVHNTAFCIHNLAGKWSPKIVTANFVYIRLHGPQGPYQWQYNRPMIRTWANKCRRWVQSGKDVYCYFDNDEKGYSATNALTLKNMIMKDAGKPVRPKEKKKRKNKANK